MRSASAAAAAALAGLCAALLACGAAPERAPRVLVVGIDGANFRVIGPLFNEGRLPHLRALAAAGAWGPLRSFPPLFSPRIWNTIATGKRPERHGIESFVREAPEGRRLYLSSDRRVPALWNILSSRGIPVSVVNWWNTFPPEKIDGVMVSDHFFPSQLEDREHTVQAGTPTGMAVHPPAWAERGVRLLADARPLTQQADPFAGAHRLPAWLDARVLSKIFRFDATVARVALDIEAREQPRALLVLLTGIDRVSHFLWGVMEPPEVYPPELRPTPEEREGGLAALRAYYEYTDALLGLLLGRYGPDDLVVVLSDHGFEAHIFEDIPQIRALRPTGGHESDAAREGVLFARGPGIAAGPAVGVSVRDITPTLLAWLGVPWGADMDGRPAAFLADPGASVPSWDDLPIERAETGGDAEAEILEQLRALGYLD